MEILLIHGSPNPKGTTYAALQEIASALHSEGIGTKLLSIGSKPYSGCLGCGRCRKTNRCVLPDAERINELLDLARAADGIIVGSPVYYASPNGALLSVLDRAFYAGSDAFAYKPCAAVVCARRAGCTASVDVLNKYFAKSDALLVGSQYWNMVFGANAQDATLDLEGLQNMRRLAANMAWILRCLDAGKRAGIPLPVSEVPLRTNFIR